MSRPRCLVASLVGAAVAASGCQEQGTTAGSAIEIRDADGRVTARIVAGPPCQVTIGATAVVVTDHLADVGGVAWTLTDAPNGTTIRRGDVATVRAFAANPRELAVMDPDGIAFVRARVTGTTASTWSGNGAPQRTLTAANDEVTVTRSDDHAPVATVTHSTDLLLAAIVTAPELAPEARALIACRHLQPPMPSPSPSPTPE